MSNLYRVHNKTRTEGVKVPCPFKESAKCTGSFAQDDADSMNRHRKAVHSASLLLCEDCDHPEFASVDALGYHIRSTHDTAERMAAVKKQKNENG